MFHARPRRLVPIALAVSLAAFSALSVWDTLTWSGTPGWAMSALVALTLSGVLAAQWLTLDLFRGDPRAVVKAAALQPVWPFLVVLIGVSLDMALRANMGMTTAGSPMTTALLFGAGLGIVGVVLITARASLGGAKPPAVIAV